MGQILYKLPQGDTSSQVQSKLISRMLGLAKNDKSLVITDTAGGVHEFKSASFMQDPENNFAQSIGVDWAGAATTIRDALNELKYQSGSGVALAVVNSVDELKAALGSSPAKAIFIATALNISSAETASVDGTCSVYGMQISFSGSGHLHLSSTNSGNVHFYNDILCLNNLDIFNQSDVSVWMRNLVVLTGKTCTLNEYCTYEIKRGSGLLTGGVQEYWDNTFQSAIGTGFFTSLTGEFLQQSAEFGFSVGQRLYIYRKKISVTFKIKKIRMASSTSGGAVQVVIYTNDAGTLHAVSSATLSFTSAGLKEVSLSSPVPVVAGQEIYVGFFVSNSQAATNSYIAGINAQAPQISANYSSSERPLAYYQHNEDTIPQSFTLSSTNVPATAQIPFCELIQ